MHTATPITHAAQESGIDAGEQAMQMAEHSDEADAHDQRLRAVLFCADKPDVKLAADALRAARKKDQLVWVDVADPKQETLQNLHERVGLDALLLPWIADWKSAPRLINSGDQFLVQVFFAAHAGELRFEGIPVTLVAAPGVVVTSHRGAVECFDELFGREDGGSALGTLNETQFLCSLLDWQIASFHSAVSLFESEVERMEERILKDLLDERTAEIATLRGAASRLRRMLEAHRPIYAGMARPDFRPQESETVERSFQHVYQNFHHAMQDVEGMRETVGGTLALITNEITLRTSRSMRLLTFVTMIVGLVAIVTGALGMNFEMPFYQTGVAGFAITLGCLAIICGALIAWGHRRDWY